MIEQMPTPLVDAVADSRAAAQAEMMRSLPPFAPRVQELKKKDYFAYMLPSLMVGPMLGYGTRLEPLLALGIGSGWAIYAVLHFAGKNRDAAN